TPGAAHPAPARQPRRPVPQTHGTPDPGRRLMSPTILTPPNPWSPPRLSWRWWPVFLRNLLVWRKLALPSVVANIADPLLALVGLGGGLGALVGSLTMPSAGATVAVPYILFLRSVRIAMSTVRAAPFGALYPASSRVHAQKT